MTPKQKEVLDFIRAFIAAHEYSPTYAEIAKAIGHKSKGPVYVRVQELARQGYLVVSRGHNRNISLPPAAPVPAAKYAHILTADLIAELESRGHIIVHESALIGNTAGASHG
jgi:SOS-response transcriptional repressor LexA